MGAGGAARASSTGTACRAGAPFGLRPSRSASSPTPVTRNDRRAGRTSRRVSPALTRSWRAASRGQEHLVGLRRARAPTCTWTIPWVIGSVMSKIEIAAMLRCVSTVRSNPRVYTIGSAHDPARRQLARSAVICPAAFVYTAASAFPYCCCQSCSGVSCCVRTITSATVMPATGSATSSATSNVRPGRRSTSRRASRSASRKPTNRRGSSCARSSSGAGRDVGVLRRLGRHRDVDDPAVAHRDDAVGPRRVPGLVGHEHAPPCPRSAGRSASSSITASPVVVSSDPVGSSASSKRRVPTIARAIAIRCCWPPEKSSG